MSTPENVAKPTFDDLVLKFRSFQLITITRIRVHGYWSGQHVSPHADGSLTNSTIARRCSGCLRVQTLHIMGQNTSEQVLYRALVQSNPNSWLTSLWNYCTFERLPFQDGYFLNSKLGDAHESLINDHPLITFVTSTSPKYSPLRAVFNLDNTATPLAIVRPQSAKRCGSSRGLPQILWHQVCHPDGGSQHFWLVHHWKNPDFKYTWYLIYPNWQAELTELSGWRHLRRLGKRLGEGGSGDTNRISAINWEHRLGKSTVWEHYETGGWSDSCCKDR